MSVAQAAPTNADRVLPPNTGQGCAKGLDGMQNTKTALAPNEATIQGPDAPCSPHQRLSSAVMRTPITAPTITRRRSRPLIPMGAGQKLLSQRLALTDNGVTALEAATEGDEGRLNSDEGMKR